MRSAAWRHMSANGKALLVHLYSLYNGVNNGELFLSVRDAAEALGVAPNTAQKTLEELQSLGFVRVAERGAFSLKSRHATTWILTEFPYRDALPTTDFMRWQPTEIQKPASKFDTDSVKRKHRDTLRRVKKEPDNVRN